MSMLEVIDFTVNYLPYIFVVLLTSWLDLWLP